MSKSSTITAASKSTFFYSACWFGMLLLAQGCAPPTLKNGSEQPSASAKQIAEMKVRSEGGEGCQTTPEREPLLTPAASGDASAAATQTKHETAGIKGMVLIPGGSFRMGTDAGMPYEGPAHEITIDAFYLDRTEVTVAQFAEFVAATGYVTEAERFGWSGVFDARGGEWRRVDGASWQHPEGGNSVAGEDEPVCQVSWNDAAAYAKWAGKRLPTEAEFERAARGGMVGKEYAWGDELRPGGHPVANWWQGEFPVSNTGEDGFLGRAPVGSFAPNGYGLYDVAGNVWEWCADWYADDYYARSPRRNPPGTSEGTERVMRGGSWLCAENYCTNYRVAGRSHSTPDTGLNNVGFRCARDTVSSTRQPK